MIDLSDAHSAVETISSKWTVAILAVLAHGTRRHNELARILELPHEPLDRALRRLESGIASPSEATR
ncbi:MAG: winged helix-turn-helix transcriptional regulator [Streptosporangiaceae bacterium]